VRLLYLYLRSRLANWAIALLAISGVIEWLWLWHFPPYGFLLSLSLVFIPLGPALVIGAGARSPFGDIERTASRSVGTLRFGHLIALFLFAALVLIAGSSRITVGIDRELIRNLAGYLGLTLLAAWLIGTGLSWVVPLGYAALALVIVPGNRLAWAVRVPIDSWSVAVAAVLVTLGLLVVTLQGTRDQTDERA
jgi:hypothetical protein